MKQFLFAIAIAATLVSCDSTKPISQEKYQKSLVKYTDKISEAELKKQLYIIAAPDMEGRNAGTEGEIKAGNYISNYYKELGINGPNNNYFQIIPAATFSRVKGQMRNVMGFIEGSEKPEEIVVISAHYDHDGIKDGKLYPGADDDGSGTVAVMEIGRIFREAEKKGIRPKRSVLLLHVSGEEKGLLGSKYYSDHPIFPLANTIANVNIDMIGRVDYEHNEQTRDFVYVIGSEMLSSDLHKAVLAANDGLGINLDMRYNTPDDPNRFYYRSDHYNFAKHNIPSVFFFNGVHDDYHKPGDTPDKIEYDLLTRRTKLAFNTIWILANAENRPVVDKESPMPSTR